MGFLSKVGKFYKGGADFLFKSPADAANKANMANEKLIKGTWQSLWPQQQGLQAEARQSAFATKKLVGEGTDKALGAINAGAVAARQDVADQARVGEAAGGQALASSGLYDSSNRAQLKVATGQSLGRAYAAIEDATSNMISNALFQKTAMDANAEGGIGQQANQSIGQNLGWGQGFTGSLGQIQHVGGPSLFQSLLMTGAQAAGTKYGAGL